VDTTPKAESSSATVDNMMIKLRFSENISQEDAQKNNANVFVLKNEKGKKIKTTPYYNEERYPNEVWLMVNERLIQATKYTLTINQKMKSSSGNTLTEPIVYTFATRDISKDGKINMALMFLMVGGMLGFTVWDTRRKMKKENDKEKMSGDNKVNPYKEAKKTGKSVEEIVAEAEKEKEKIQAKNPNLIEEKPVKTEQIEEVREGVMRVSARKPISAVGCKTPASVTAKRKAKQEQLKKEQERRKASQKSKGSKQQQRKKRK
ncbi:MAG: hypothetical protein EOM85_04895, partial [Candidatus Moranbacteria bacterium]|nr:hypothetical protein [Candidatus Moranbacteria bacterium]